MGCLLTFTSLFACASLCECRAHCQNGDKKCLKKQLKAGTGLDLPTKRLVAQLKEAADREDRVDNLLKELNVPTIHVTYEKLFLAGSDTAEWMRIFEFLGVGPTANLTVSEVEQAGHAATSIPFHNITLSNYEEVKDVLDGTEFYSLLH